MSAWRKLRKEEVDLIAAILVDSPKANEILPSLPDRLVEDTKDGAMGRLPFIEQGGRERLAEHDA
jgi:hypothetical protein